MAWLRPIDRWFADHVFLYQDVHRKYARRLIGDASEAEDLVQEAYSRIFAIENWASIADPHGFTMRIIHNAAVDRFRRAGVVRIEDGALLQALDPADKTPLPDVIAHDRAELRRLARTLDTLPERCREAVLLRRIEGLPPAKVAERMNISVSTMEKHLTKGIRLLVQRMAIDEQPDEARRVQKWTETGRGKTG